MKPTNRPPRLFRPLFSLGILVVFLAVFMALMSPGLMSSPLGVIGLAAAFLLGAAAVTVDLRNLSKELKDRNPKE